MFETLLFIHIFTAIVAIGPAFILPLITSSAKTRQQLIWAFQLFAKIERFPKLGAIIMLLTGVGIMLTPGYNYHQGWLAASIILFIIFAAISYAILPKRLKAAADSLQTGTGDAIPAEFQSKMRAVRPFVGSMHLLLLLIIILMITKPF